jgi:PAS domain S-box-containing protein
MSWPYFVDRTWGLRSLRQIGPSWANVRTNDGGRMNTYGKIEEALKKCEEKFSKDFRESPLVLTLTSAVDHRYLDVNQAFERVSGWERKEVIGRTPFDLGIWVYPNERLAFERRLLAGETIHGLEVRARMRHGELRTISGSAILMEIDGETSILSLITDVTDRTLLTRSLNCAKGSGTRERKSKVS